MTRPLESVRLRKVNLNSDLSSEMSGFLSPKTSKKRNSSSLRDWMMEEMPLMRMLCPSMEQESSVVFLSARNMK